MSVQHQQTWRDVEFPESVKFKIEPIHRHAHAKYGELYGFRRSKIDEIEVMVPVRVSSRQGP